MKHIKLLGFLAFALLSFSTMSFAQEATTEIEGVTPIRAKLLLQKKTEFVFIDVREDDEVKALAYDVEGMLHIPLSDIKNRLTEIPNNKTLIMACRSGNRSGKAAKILAKNGYTNIMNLEGGMRAWQAKKLPVLVNGKSTKKACCANPNSKDCNPDGTCKKPAKATKKCCSGSKKSCSKKK